MAQTDGKLNGAKHVARGAVDLMYLRFRHWMNVAAIGICITVAVGATTKLVAGSHRTTAIDRSTSAGNEPPRVTDLEYSFWIRPTLETWKRKPDLPKDGWYLEGAKFLTFSPGNIEIVYYYRSRYGDRLQGSMDWHKAKNPRHGDWSAPNPKDSSNIMEGTFDLVEIAPFRFQGTKTGFDRDTGKVDEYTIMLTPK